MTAQVLTEQELRKLCKLARLNPELEDLQGLQQHFSKMLAYMEELRSVDLGDLDVLGAAAEGAGHLRPDVPVESLESTQTFANTQNEEFGHFTIPKVIGG
jgi:aspartyl-tRNA(Asn)/glutamyl-tRNA(Gln) amidotransferase subunit C